VTTRPDSNTASANATATDLNTATGGDCPTCRGCSRSMAEIARGSSTLIALGGVLMLSVAGFHPVAHAHDFAGLIADIAQQATANEFVHGMAIVATAVLFGGTLGLTQVLGSDRLLPRIALVAMLVGSAAMIAAASVDGFLITRLCQAPNVTEPDTAERLRPLFLTFRMVNQYCAQLGVIAMGLALVGWSLEMLHRRDSWRWIGALGLLAGAAPAGLVMIGTMVMNVHGLMVFVVAHAAWYAAAATRLRKNA